VATDRLIGPEREVGPVQSLLNGSLLAADVEVERVPLTDGVEEGAQLGRRGRVRPGAPAAPEEGPGIQPPTHLAERPRPGDRVWRWPWLVGRHFPPASAP
jgi:hypothetical protein